MSVKRKKNLQDKMPQSEGGPLKLRDFKIGQKFGKYRLNQQIRHHFEGLYLSHF